MTNITIGGLMSKTPICPNCKTSQFELVPIVVNGCNASMQSVICSSCHIVIAVIEDCMTSYQFKLIKDKLEIYE